MEHKVLPVLQSIFQKVKVKFLYIPSNSNLEILTGNLDSILLNVFSNSSISRSTFDGLTDYYHLSSDVSSTYPINKIATHFKRVYTSNYSLNNSIKGDILVVTSSDTNPSIMSYFLDQVLLYYVSIEKTIL